MWAFRRSGRPWESLTEKSVVASPGSVRHRSRNRRGVWVRPDGCGTLTIAAAVAVPAEAARARAVDRPDAGATRAGAARPGHAFPSSGTPLSRATRPQGPGEGPAGPGSGRSGGRENDNWVPWIRWISSWLGFSSSRASAEPGPGERWGGSGRTGFTGAPRRVEARVPTAAYPASIDRPAVAKMHMVPLNTGRAGSFFSNPGDSGG